MVTKHENCGSLWVKKLKSGGTTLVGYAWFYDRTIRKRRVYTIKVKRNMCKTNATAPDYCLYDYTKERENARKVSIHGSYQEVIASKARKAAGS